MKLISIRKQKSLECDYVNPNPNLRFMNTVNETMFNSENG